MPIGMVLIRVTFTFTKVAEKFADAISAVMSNTQAATNNKVLFIAILATINFHASGVSLRQRGHTRN
jgi:hypothetical protein